jgi:allantoinase
MNYDLVIRAKRAIVEGREIGCVLGVRDGRIVAIEPCSAKLVGRETLELEDDSVLLPGLVDSHVHICDPGNAEWEGFAPATRAAAAGGVTTLVDMPLDSSPTTVNVGALEAKRQAAGGQCYVDVGFWAGAIPSNLSDMESLHDAGVLGFKCFLCDTGIDEFPGVSPSHMHKVLEEVRRLGSILLVHAEAAEVLNRMPNYGGRVYAEYLATRPRGAENLAIAQVIEAARATRGRAHVLHLSSSDALSMIVSARREGVEVSVETCPHYLSLCAEGIGEGQTSAKVGPPVRERENRETLWQALSRGDLAMVVSDHSPCTPEMKCLATGDFGTAWGGISSLQLALPVTWTEAKQRGFGLTDIVRWMAEEPAKVANLAFKGRIAKGYDADFCIFAPEETFIVSPARLHHRHPVTPYAGRKLRGVARQAILRGRSLELNRRPIGRLLTRTTQSDAEPRKEVA